MGLHEYLSLVGSRMGHGGEKSDVVLGEERSPRHLLLDCPGEEYFSATCCPNYDRGKYSDILNRSFLIDFSEGTSQSIP